MRSFLIFLSAISSLTLHAGNKITWSKGTVVEKDGQIKIGEVSFHSVDLILFRVDEKVTVYTPHQVKSFFFYDQESNVNRKFDVIRTDDFNVPLFFEYVVWGKAQMIRVAKNKLLIKNKLRDVFDYDYYVCWQGKYTKVKNFKHDVYPMLVEEMPILGQIVNKEKLKSGYTADIANIIKLYNRGISQPTDLIARN